MEMYTNIKKYKGFSSGIFLLGYGISRFFIEFFREPDIQIGYIFDCWTLGQLLTLPIIIFGIVLIIKSYTKNY